MVTHLSSPRIPQSNAEGASYGLSSVVQFSDYGVTISAISVQRCTTFFSKCVVLQRG